MKANRAIKILICFLLIIPFTLPNVVFAVQSDKTEKSKKVQVDTNPAVKAASAILTDSERGQVLFGENPDSRLHIAALCKLMTILIAVEAEDPSSSVTISKDSVIDAQGSALSLEVGEKYQLEDLLCGIMLTSANDAANAVAEHISKDIPSFVIKMNEMAAKLQMKDTNFTNPTGLYDENQYTTARDIAVFIKYACNNLNFNRIFGIQFKPWTNKDGKSKILTSPNRLFWSYSGIDGGKTGYNTKEQQSVIAVATRDGMKLICIILDSPEESLFTDAEAVFDLGFKNYRMSRLVQKGAQLKTVNVEGADISLISGNDVFYVHPAGDSYIKSFDTSVDLQPPISTSKLAGNARYTLNDDTIIDVGLYPATEAPPPEDDFITAAKKTLLENRDILILLIILIFLEAVLIIHKVFKFFKWLFRKKLLN